jgi:hypothetical protein
MEAFIHNWKLWSDPVARFKPDKQTPEFDWRYCETVYTLVPLEGRHQDATYRIKVTLNPSPTGTESYVGRHESTVELPLKSEMWPDNYVHFRGEDEDGNKLLEFRCDQKVAEGYLGDISDYETIVVQFEYQEALLEAQADQYGSLEEARNKFVDYIEHRNEGLGWDLDPQATFGQE